MKTNKKYRNQYDSYCMLDNCMTIATKCIVFESKDELILCEEHYKEIKQDDKKV